MQKKLSFCFLRQNLSAFVETETYRNRKFDPDTEIEETNEYFVVVAMLFSNLWICSFNLCNQSMCIDCYLVFLE